MHSGLGIFLSLSQTAELAVSVDRVRPPAADSQDWAEIADSTVQAAESQRTTGNQGNGLVFFCGIKMEKYILSDMAHCIIVGIDPTALWL